VLDGMDFFCVHIHVGDVWGWKIIVKLRGELVLLVQGLTEATCLIISCHVDGCFIVRKFINYLMQGVRELTGGS